MWIIDVAFKMCLSIFETQHAFERFFCAIYILEQDLSEVKSNISHLGKNEIFRLMGVLRT